MKPVELIVKEGDEHLTSHSGLALVGALINRTELEKRVDSTILAGCQEPKISHGDIVKSMIGLMCMAKPDYDAIEEFREIPFFGHSLGIDHCPASPTLRQRLDVVNGAFDQIIKEESANLIRNTAVDIGTVSTSKGIWFPWILTSAPLTIPRRERKVYRGHTRAMMDLPQFLRILARKVTRSMSSFGRALSIPRKTLRLF